MQKVQKLFLQEPPLAEPFRIQLLEGQPSSRLEVSSERSAHLGKVFLLWLCIENQCLQLLFLSLTMF